MRPKISVLDPNKSERAFTIIELLIVVVIVSILATIGISSYSRVRDRAMIVRAIGDIRALQQDISEYQIVNNAYPSSLSDVGRDTMRDPWGNPYQYLPISGKGKGGFRKDRFLVPLNTDFDLYSMGPDGASVPPLTAKASRDDIIRAADGGFVGEAANY